MAAAWEKAERPTPADGCAPMGEDMAVMTGGLVGERNPPPNLSVVPPADELQLLVVGEVTHLLLSCSGLMMEEVGLDARLWWWW